MFDYQILKTIHIVSASLLFGTGLGTAFHFWMTHIRKDPKAIAIVAGNVVLADFLFTTPAVVVQPLTGFLMAFDLGFPITEGWIAWSLALYALTGACWLPVVWLQMRLHRMAKRAVAENAPLPPEYFRVAWIWFALGWPAFLAVLGIFYLMVFKPF